MTTYNIPLVRGVLDYLRRNPIEHDQSSWMTCIAGHAIRIHGEHGLLRTGNPLTDGFQTVDFHTGRVEYTDDVAARLLGMTDEEAAGLFTSTNSDALDWLTDIVASCETAVLNHLAADIADARDGEVTA
ncbi:hypothetical protein [Nocardia farcinica]|uniref:hypothetical protein n=1 Tax=Nocardia farcinica TaxID=37329 RepID=UPI0024558726|nr:hypothetical protein [Nocardia farcinica]